MAPEAGRLAYLDNLKVLLVAGVIAVHVGIIYGVDGSFYLEDYDSMSDVAVGLMTVLAGVGFLFGLRAFFLIAGRLSGPSLDRKGPRRFMLDRLVRLGLPVVFLHRTAVPAELKFALVLAGGVAGAFEISALIVRAPTLRKVVGSGPQRSPSRRMSATA
jgi:peptidoglycan/LPS O-acetylase OafA/YrhL